MIQGNLFDVLVNSKDYYDVTQNPLHPRARKSTDGERQDSPKHRIRAYPSKQVVKRTCTIRQSGNDRTNGIIKLKTKRTDMAVILILFSLNVMAQCSSDYTAPSMICSFNVFNGARYVHSTDIDTPLITDNCDTNLIPTLTFTEGFYNVGLHYLQWRTQDNSGNIAICNGVILVNPCVSPVIIDSTRIGDYLTIRWNDTGAEYYKVYMGNRVQITGSTSITVKWNQSINVYSDCHNNCCN